MRPFGKVIAFAFSLVALPVAADVVYYDLTIRGFKVAELEVAAQETRRNYSVAGTINSTGLTRIVRKLNYSGTTRGTIKNRRLVPQTYSEQANTAGYDTAVSTVSDCPTPTVSISTTSKPAASHSATASRDRRATPPKCV